MAQQAGRWVLSFHGGSSGIDYLMAYDETWQHPSRLLPSVPVTQELRGFALQGSTLYVLEAHKTTSRILMYSVTGSSISFSGVFATATPDGQYPDAPVTTGLVHPFALTSGSDGTWYVSNQDTNVVLALGADGKALPVTEYLTSLPITPPWQFLAGTIVASAIGQLPLSPPGPVPPLVAGPEGLGLNLQVSPIGGAGVSNSVRDVLAVEGALYVADEVSDTVKAYDRATGSLLGTIQGSNLSGPVHLLLAGNTLYIGSSGNDSIVTLSIANGPPSGVVAPTTFADSTVPSVSGLAVDPSGNIYAALRKKREVVVMKADQKPSDKPQPVATGLPDEPEFVVYMTLPQTSS